MEIDRVNKIYTELLGYEINLTPDPKSLGPLYMQGIIATCRNLLNNVSRLLLETHQARQEIQRSLTGCRALYDIESNELLANDDRVKRCPSIDDRRATVMVILRDRYRQIQDLEAELETVDLVEKAIKLRHRELKDTMSAINAQRALMRDEIDTRSLYGDERPPAIADSELNDLMGTETLPNGIRLPPGTSTTRSFTDSGRQVDDFLEAMDAEFTLPAEPVVPEPPNPEPVASEPKTTTTVPAVQEPEAPDEIDFEKILAGL